MNAKQRLLAERLSVEAAHSTWVLRISEQKQYTGPVLTVCERTPTGEPEFSSTSQLSMALDVPTRPRTKLKEWGRIFNGHLRVCLPAIREIVSGIQDDEGAQLDVAALLDERLEFRGKLPLDETSGTKLALLFRLHGLVRKDNRTELMAWRIARFSREEAMYWFAKTTVSAYGKSSVNWAKAGLRVMLAGQQNNPVEVDRLLAQLRK